MRINISRTKIKDDFVAKVEEISGQNLLACYQCGKCSAGCPAVSEMDILPNQIIRYAQLSLKDELLKSKSIWTSYRPYQQHEEIYVLVFNIMVYNSFYLNNIRYHNENKLLPRLHPEKQCEKL